MFGQSTSAYLQRIYLQVLCDILRIIYILCFRATDMNGRNTLFLHLLCWNIEYSRELVDNMLKSIFMHDPYVQYIAFVKTAPGCLRMFIFPLKDFIGVLLFMYDLTFYYKAFSCVTLELK